MRVSKTLAGFFACLVVAPFAPADDVGAALDKVVAARDAEAAAKSLTAKAEAEFRELWTALLKRVDELKLTGPVVPPDIKPPAPVDPFVAKFKAAYVADPGDPKDPTKKPETLLTLAELCRQVSDYPEETKEVGPDGKKSVVYVYSTVQELATKAKEVAKKLQEKGFPLPGTWVAIKAEIAAAFPFEEALTKESRASTKAFFLRLEAAIKEAGK